MYRKKKKKKKKKNESNKMEMEIEMIIIKVRRNHRKEWAEENKSKKDSRASESEGGLSVKERLWKGVIDLTLQA